MGNFCSNCGAQVTGKFCSNCGAPTDGGEAAAEGSSVQYETLNGVSFDAVALFAQRQARSRVSDQRCSACYGRRTERGESLCRCPLCGCRIHAESRRIYAVVATKVPALRINKYSSRAEGLRIWQRRYWVCFVWPLWRIPRRERGEKCDLHMH